MSLTQKLIVFCLFFVFGTGAAALYQSRSEAEQQLRAQVLASCDAEATRIVDALGGALLQQHLRPEHAATRAATLATLNRLLQRSPNHEAIYSLNCIEGGALVSHEVRRNAEPRIFGTGVPLSLTGHRAARTETVQTELLQDRDGVLACTFAPIHEHGRIAGLLVSETRLDPKAMVLAGGWPPLLLCLAGSVVGLLVLLARLGRPLERMQDQLIAKQGIGPQNVRSASDLLREITRIIDSASSDRDYYEARLKQQDRMQESSTRRKDEVISNTVHELRTPLTSIVASLEIMLDNEEQMTADEKREFTSQASAAARHMMYVVNDMLDAAALEAGEFQLEIEPCNLRSILQDARRSMEIIATARAMTLSVADVDPEIQVMADPARLMQVIFNLVSNAVKYTPSGSAITMRAWPSLKSVIIEVEDQGNPIPAEKRDRLFRKFAKLERDADAPPVNSSGIGLYISKQLIESMQGTIGYRALEQGEGSVFWFTLPICREGSRIGSGIGSGTGAAAMGGML